MIAITLSGGLGNQMFEYAFIYAQHKRLHTSFFLMKHGVPSAISKYFELEKNFFYHLDQLAFDYNGFKLFFSHYLRNFVHGALLKAFVFKRLSSTNVDQPKEFIARTEDSTLYHGYYQSEKYFEDYRESVIKAFKLKGQYISTFQSAFSWLKQYKKVVTLHIRRTDYATAFGYLDLGSDDLTLPIIYYKKLLTKIHSPENFYVFISDEIDLVKTEFANLSNTYFSDKDEITDFQLMLNADVCVIANSSFSWWAAYLNRKASKEIYCPTNYLGYKVGKEYPVDIYPDSWIKVDVE